MAVARFCFNPRSPCGERLLSFPFWSPVSGFNPRSPCGERPELGRLPNAEHMSFNPRSPCGERQYERVTEGDIMEFQPTLPLRGATIGDASKLGNAQFQPTLPLRGATADPAYISIDVEVSTHAPLAGSDLTLASPGNGVSGFNPRSPCGERQSVCQIIPGLRQFQPTLPLRGATLLSYAVEMMGLVSTHAPLAGSDCYILLM